MKVEILTTGFCTHPEFIVFRGGAFRRACFPATVVLIDHPRHGRVLFDTGYSGRFFDVTRRFPERLYALTTPVTLRPEETAAYQLRERGIDAGDIDHVILSHFHADHVGAVADFPKARYRFLPDAYSRVACLSRFQRTRRGFLKDLLPDDFLKRAAPITIVPRSDLPGIADFHPGYDLFGDGSLIGVPLPGHAAGHMGLWIPDMETPTLFASDAVWSADQLSGKRHLRGIAHILSDNRHEYDDTIRRLRRFQERQPNARVIPCHCQMTHHQLRAEAAR